MNVESILRQKGTEVATITPEASIKRAADWLRAKNVGAGQTVKIFPNVDLILYGHWFRLSSKYALRRRKYAFSTLPDISVKCSRMRVIVHGD